jgi:hypothetical protein
VNFGRLAACGALLVLTAAQVGGAPKLVFDFRGPNPAGALPWKKTSTLAEGWSTGGWVFGDGIAGRAPRADRLVFGIDAGAELSTLRESIAAQRYLAVSVRGPQLGGSKVEFRIRRESFHAPLRYALRWSVDRFTSDLFLSPMLEPADAAEDDFAFLLPPDVSATGMVEFRIYPHAARYAGHEASLAAFSISHAGEAYRLQLTAGKGGTVSADPARTLFEQGESVRLIAKPSKGYRFGGWRGDVRGFGNPRTVGMSGEKEVRAHFIRNRAEGMSLGGNPDAVTDYSTAWVFRNCFLMARPWLTREVGDAAWESGGTPPVDADGWPTVVPFVAPGAGPRIVHTLVPLYGPGKYEMRFEGRGRIRLLPPGGKALLCESGGGGFVGDFTLPATEQGRVLLLEIHESAATDPVRRIEILAPGQTHADAVAQPFHPVFIASLAPYRVLRFMDWQRTNGSRVRRWADRTTATHATQARDEGVSHEMIIRLCNRVSKHPWICIPHLADDVFVRNTARLYRDRLEPGLVLHVEYSNETWNSLASFTQTPHVMERGTELGLSANAWEAGQRYVARRSGEIFRIFREEFGAAQRHRVLCVLASQAASAASVTRMRIEGMNDPRVNPGGHLPDALAIAPYFGVNYEPADPGAGPDVDPLPAVDDLVTSLSRRASGEAAQWVREHRRLADAQGWRLLGYEGGQHFTGVFGAENDDRLTARLLAANRDPRMETRYLEYFAALEDAGLHSLAHFSHIGEWSKWGSWGVLEFQDQPASRAPKWRALLRHSRRVDRGAAR